MKRVSPLVEQVISGAVPELRILAAQGLLPLAPADLIPLQVFLAVGPDPTLSASAHVALRALEPRALAEFLTEDAAETELSFFAAESTHPLIVDAILRRRITPRLVLMELARRLTPDLQEILLLRQDAIVEEPAILDALEENPRVTPYTLRRIAELREHVLTREPGAGAAAGAEPGAGPAALGDLETGLLADPEVAAAIAAVRGEPPTGEQDEITGLSEGQIRMLPVGVRMRLSRGAARTLRTILIRDNYPPVAVSVLENNTWSDQELEGLSRNRSVAIEVLESITRRREWVRKYPIMLGIVSNPRTPVSAALKLLPALGTRDLRNLSRDRNVSDAVRSRAVSLYRMKTV